ncbi:dipeptidase [Mesorhizobium sp. M0955]|uniref:dipeptidase n=1 Tax=Mesorhizobium sp. M0955 TaxID=2957033 RepID=UPI003334E99F
MVDMYEGERDAAQIARQIFADSIIWDTHAGVACRPTLDLGFVSRWRQGGASFVGLNVGWDALPWQESLKCAAHYRRWLELHSDQYVLVDRFADVERAKRDGKLAVALDLEGADALNDNIEMIGLYHRLGVRQMNLAYNKNNAFAGGCTDEEDIPLTALGREAIAEMNRVGMVVDCTHTGYRSSMEIMEISKTPVIFTHSNPRALWDHERNLRDDQIKACARTGGVVGVNGVSKYLARDEDCTPETVINHIDYVASLVGVDHVGIGLDAVLDPDEMPNLVKEFPNIWPASEASQWDYGSWSFIVPEQLGSIAEGLLLRQYSEADVKKIMGENFARVAAAVWM